MFWLSGPPILGVRRPVVVAGISLAALAAASVRGYLNLPPAPGYVTVDPWGYGSLEILREILPAFGFGVAGLVAWHRRSANPTGPLMIVIAGAILLKGFQAIPVPALVSLGIWASIPPGLSVTLLGILVLIYPNGRVSSRADLIWVVSALLAFLSIQLAWTAFIPAVRDMCADCRPLFVMGYNDYVRVTLRNVSMLLHSLLALGLIVLIARRWAGASGPSKRLLAPISFAGTVVAVITVVSFTVRSSIRLFSDAFAVPIPSLGDFIATGQIPVEIYEFMPVAIAISLFLVPVALLWGLLRSHLGQAAVSSLAIQLQRVKDGPTLTDGLRRALGDPSLELALWSRPAQAYVTPDGLPVTLPAGRGSRGVTRLQGDGGPLAAMIHDPALAEQRQLVDGVSAVAQLALENERLHAEVKAQLEEVRASRQRIVSAADEERRRVERNLHDGAQQRLVSLSLALSMAHAKAAAASPEVADTLSGAETELQQAIGELRELARGIHPAILTEAGLKQAIESLAEHAPVSVVVDAQLNGRLPPVIEATAYFVIAEALTNVAKHAGGTAAMVRVTTVGDQLHIRVADNGRGGADPDRGSGIRGLTDRVAALGGSLRVGDAPDGGTRLEAEIPCASA